MNKIGFPTLLFLLFMTLKLTGVIAWSWVWVTAPLWLGLVVWLVFVVIILKLFMVWGNKL